MEEFLLPDENIIETREANFLLSLTAHGLPKFGLFGAGAEMRLLDLPDNHESIGGHLFLTNYRLFFRSHKFNRFKGSFSLLLPDIIEIKDVSHFISKIMKIVARENIFDFIVWGIPEFTSAIITARDFLEPAQIESLRAAAKSSAEKCGEGELESKK